MIEAMLSILMKRGCSEYLEIAKSGRMRDSSVTLLHARDLRGWPSFEGLRAVVLVPSIHIHIVLIQPV